MTHDEKLVHNYATQNGFNHFDDLFEEIGRHVYSLSLLDDNGVSLPIGLPVFVEIINGVVSPVTDSQYDEIMSFFQE